MPLGCNNTNNINYQIYNLQNILEFNNLKVSIECYLNNNKIYHDYKGWLDSFENKFKIIDKEIFFVDNISQKALDEKILIS